MNYRLSKLMKHVIAEYILNNVHRAECDCGKYSKGCKFNSTTYKKECICKEDYYERFGSCIECDCGRYSRSCKFDSMDQKCECEMDTLLTEVHVKNVIVAAILKVANLIGLENSVNVKKDMRAKMEPAQNATVVKTHVDVLSFQMEPRGVIAPLIMLRIMVHVQLFAWYQLIAPTELVLCEEIERTCRAMDAVCVLKNSGAYCQCPPGKKVDLQSGLCTDICDPGKCVHGTCEVVELDYSCKCDEGYTGLHCEKVIEPKPNNSVLWTVALLSVNSLICVMLFAIFCLLCCRRK
ncbi:adhesive plaque matrix protein 2 [Trichonephila inaurata madagascariensis]|uniref:Adhesive plaque matrix protein 2 n=1 Tax=Trichonephila inaurata madagascariensis TaxID=2747483 RepID=A0A8X7BUJ8_9ARAC|nr:adhesive plaque matrix protein 2 [Trichonephila inaurata madagascariensis]